MSKITDLWGSLFPEKNRVNMEELRAGMAEYVAATYQPAPKKSAEKRPQSTTPIPKKPEMRERTAKPAQHPPQKRAQQEAPKHPEQDAGAPEGPAFPERLQALMKERKVSKAQVCKRAGLDKTAFDNLADERSAPPARDTVIALALALECSPEEAKGLLESAGYTLTHSSRRDIMIEYLFKEKIHDLKTANALLEQMKQKPGKGS